MSGRSWKEPAETAWQVPLPDPKAAAGLGTALRSSPVLGQILLNRGFPDEEGARGFLDPSLSALEDPARLPGIEPAVDRILAAVRSGEEIVVFGDYDVDGISGTAVLAGFLQVLGANVRPHLPNRLEDGYGLSEGAVEKLVAEGVGLLVTVDHGTTANAEIDLAAAKGLDVVVVDHHTPGADLPAAVAVVNPHLLGEGGPLPCGAGVAFKVAWALATRLAGGGPRVADVHREYLADVLALVALGTIADVVPLLGENRIFSRFGLKMLARSKRPGLKALLERSKVTGDSPTAGDVGFKLAPRLNAAGRMGEADLALELLMTDSPERADEIARRLDRENLRRREIEREILDRVLDRLDRDYPADHTGAFVVGEQGWHPGVIGIVASRLVDRFFRPAAVVAFDGEIGRGSCRSIPAVPLPEVLTKCAEHLVSFGGHAAAAGFTVHVDRFEAFREAFDEAVREMVGPEDFVRRIRVDLVTTIAGVTRGLVTEIDRLAPFGQGNPRPVLAARGVRVAGRARRVGKNGDHLSFLASDGQRSIKAIGFRMGPLAEGFPSSKAIVDIAFTPRFDDWRADGSIELELKDLVLADG